MKFRFEFLILIIIGSNSCTNNVNPPTEPQTLFTSISNNVTNIDFENEYKQRPDFNFLNYQYIYAGGGVAVGDINNDGLDDVYFSSNSGSNKLYLNKGKFQFEDITAKAGVVDDKGWSTGVNMVDINNDGFLDIYVCKSASVRSAKLRRNKLYINQGDNTFKEEAQKWGLDHFGFSIQSYFLDYDNDGDLDMYLVNHRVDFQNTRQFQSKQLLKQESTDYLFRNDNKTFTDVTSLSGLGNYAWGLSASVGDFNNDGWLDIYVANDYIQPDHLYINNQDGTFEDQILDRFGHISYNSMGSDLADINNDLLPDLIVLDMLAEDHKRSKENMATMNPKGFKMMVDSGFHHAYMSNMLHLNNGNGTFSDIGQLSGIAKTDWSWSPLIADFDHDGFKDIIITNGIDRDLNNQDYRQQLIRAYKQNANLSLEQVENMMPSNRLANYVFKNNGDLTFSNMVEKWGLKQQNNANGVAYSDLDNDGDLDLIINNQSNRASIYKNNTNNNYLKIKLIGGDKNINALGTNVYVYSNGVQHQQHFTTRGYLSSTTNTLNFGLEKEQLIDSIKVIWYDGTVKSVRNVKANQLIKVVKVDAEANNSRLKSTPSLLSEVDITQFGVNFVHKENENNDYDIQTLLPQKQSQLGPALTVGDINNDGLDDFYIGGARNQAGAIYIQDSSGVFHQTNMSLLHQERLYEDDGAAFLDIDSDGDLDLYICSGGYELKENDVLLQDRLYINNGLGQFLKKEGVLPELLTATKKVVQLDYDQDGDQDLIVGGRLTPSKYPMPPRSYVLRNSNGVFSDVTSQVAPEISSLGLIKDILIDDYDNDGDEDLFVVGEWMSISLFENKSNRFEKVNKDIFDESYGWWNTIKAIDIDKDGDQDYVIGNLGENNKFQASPSKPLLIYSGNFDDNESYDMALSKKYKGGWVPLRGKECSTEQTPFLSTKVTSYKDFASFSMEEIYGEDNIRDAMVHQATTFSSIIMINNGSRGFEFKKLPMIAQMGPTSAIEIMDINKDGHLDIIGLGAIHEAEVETIRYDANTGYVLLGDSQGNFSPLSNSGLFTTKNTKNMCHITIQGNSYFLVGNNNDIPQLFKVR